MINKFFLLSIIFGLFSIVCSSCKKSSFTRSEIISYIENPENGLIDTKETGSIKAELMYKPWQLIQYDEQIARVRADLKTKSIEEKKVFFILQLSSGNKELLKQLNFNQYSELVQVLSFRMMNFIALKMDDDKVIIPEDCIFQQTFGLGSSNELIIVFKDLDLTKVKSLQILIKEFGLGMGDLDYHFLSRNINKLSNLTIK